MKRYIVTALFLMIVLTGSIAFAEGSKTDCNCKKFGLGIPIGKFFIGFGGRTFNSIQGCNTNFALGVVLGGDNGGAFVGPGYNEGIISLGLGVKGPETTTGFGFGIGYDYGDCRLVWPYEE
jgi:hypothetical protein